MEGERGSTALGPENGVGDGDGDKTNFEASGSLAIRDEGECGEREESDATGLFSSTAEDVVPCETSMATLAGASDSAVCSLSSRSSSSS